jgi:hypothetical protein
VGQIHPPLPVKLIVPMLAAQGEAFQHAEEMLVERYGPLDYRSIDLPFDFTDYYTAELGTGILRRFLAFRDLIDPGEIAGIKVHTNELEQALADGQTRAVNLDPGYICGGKLVLATTKDQSHRIYLGHGIYAEVTLTYRARAFRPLPWTYPDYASPGYHKVFNLIRDLYMAQLRARRSEP